MTMRKDNSLNQHLLFADEPLESMGVKERVPAQAFDLKLRESVDFEEHF